MLLIRVCKLCINPIIEDEYLTGNMNLPFIEMINNCVQVKYWKVLIIWKVRRINTCINGQDIKTNCKDEFLML